jgi:drug/metabolite transporter (DMT)-like permease
VTVFLAWMIFRDRLSAGQWGGVAAVIGGVLMVSISVN